MKKMSFPYLYTFREMRPLGYGYTRLHPGDEARFHGYNVHFVTGGNKTQTIFSLVRTETHKGKDVNCVLYVFVRRRRLAVTINNMRKGSVDNITVRVIAKRHGWDDSTESDGSEYDENNFYYEEVHAGQEEEADYDESDAIEEDEYEEQEEEEADYDESDAIEEDEYEEQEEEEADYDENDVYEEDEDEEQEEEETDYDENDVYEEDEYEEQEEEEAEDDDEYENNVYEEDEDEEQEEEEAEDDDEYEDEVYEEQEDVEAEDDDGERDISMEVNIGHYVAPLPEDTKLLALVQITKR